jgi:hypothetical protein
MIGDPGRVGPGRRSVCRRSEKSERSEKPETSEAFVQRVLVRRFAALLLSAVVACGDQPSDPPTHSPDPSVYVAGVIRDQDGMPVPFALAVWEAWPAPDSVEGDAAGTSNSVRWHARTDSQGRFAAHLGYYSMGQLDSLEVVAATDDCWGYKYSPVRDRLIPLSAAAPDTVFNRVLTLLRTAPRARLTVGSACAVTIVEDVPGLENRFGLWIDEISDSIRGRWRINYGWSRGDDIGRFSGWRAGNLVVLELRVDTPYETGLPSGLHWIHPRDPPRGRRHPRLGQLQL